MQRAPGVQRWRATAGKVATEVHLPKAKTTQGPWPIWSFAGESSPPGPNRRLSVDLEGFATSPISTQKTCRHQGDCLHWLDVSSWSFD